MNRVLLAGATGYLGRYIAKELLKRNYPVRALARNPEKLKQNNIEVTEILQAEITQPDSIKDCCRNIEVYGPIEFFMTVMAMDMVAPEYGRHTLREYLTNLKHIKV
jgi:nucleoside-diphosphate-sugar epimerase